MYSNFFLFGKYNKILLNVNLLQKCMSTSIMDVLIYHKMVPIPRPLCVGMRFTHTLLALQMRSWGTQEHGG